MPATNWQNLSASALREKAQAFHPTRGSDPAQSEAARAINQAADAVEAQDEEGLVSATIRMAYLEGARKEEDPKNPPTGGGTSGGGTSGMKCKSKCQRHLDNGDAQSYAVCWWDCWVSSF